jgi:putative FmdB family regulatory protein
MKKKDKPESTLFQSEHFSFLKQPQKKAIHFKKLNGYFQRGLTERDFFVKCCRGLCTGGVAMPIYEFYCKKCHTIFNFFSSTINTDKRPLCPKCRKVKLERQMSLFSRVRQRGEEEDSPMPDIDESKLEQAMSVLGREAENLDENDPKQAANLMRKLSDMTGMNLGSGMEEALRRMEAGEDPEQIEQEMGDLLEGEDPFSFGDKKAGKGVKRRPPAKDETLYEL